MRYTARLAMAVLAATLSTAACLSSPAPNSSLQLVTSNDQPAASGQPTAGPYCPPALKCVDNRPILVDADPPGDGTYNYTPAYKDGHRQRYFGMVIHTTEAPYASVNNMSHDASGDRSKISSWHYLVKTDGSVESSVPLNATAYDSANRTFNTQYVQVEVIGSSGKCDMTDEEYRSLGELGRYLGQELGFQPSFATILGHDNVPGVNDYVQTIQHWDPGPCFDWQRLLSVMGAPDIPHGDTSQSVVVTVTPPFRHNDQPLAKDPQVKVPGLNYATVYSAPDETSPLLSDPYVHQDGAPGYATMEDWGDKAPYGRQYVVAMRQKGWTGLWFNGQIGWVENDFVSPAGDPVTIVTPKNGKATVYGRPMPTSAEFDASDIPDDIWKGQAVPADLTHYAFEASQAYVVIPVTVDNAFFEGCDKTDCSNPGDGTVVSGSDQYLMIGYGHRVAYVKAADVATARR